MSLLLSYEKIIIRIISYDVKHARIQISYPTCPPRCMPALPFGAPTGYLQNHNQPRTCLGKSIVSHEYFLAAARKFRHFHIWRRVYEHGDLPSARFDAVASKLRSGLVLRPTLLSGTPRKTLRSPTATYKNTISRGHASASLFLWTSGGSNPRPPHCK